MNQPQRYLVVVKSTTLDDEGNIAAASQSVESVTLEYLKFFFDTRKATLGTGTRLYLHSINGDCQQTSILLAPEQSKETILNWNTTLINLVVSAGAM